MFFCLVLSRLSARDAQPAVRRIAGQRWVLDVIESPAEGLYYPHLASRIDADSYRFFAGRLAGVKPSSELPAGHPVSAGHADDWRFTDDEPGGSWLALKFDRRHDTLSIASDIFLLQRWYYLESGGRWYFSNSLRFLQTVAEPRPEIEERSVPYLLLFNYLPNRYTPLKGVYSVRPGESLTVHDGKGRINQRAELPFERSDDSLFAGEDPAALQTRIYAGALARMRDAVGAELEHLDEVLVPLSGGMDSRFVLGCALEKLGPERIITYTFGRPEATDFQIGTRIARELGLRNVHVPMESRPLAAILDDGFAAGEGMKLAIPNSPIGPQRAVLPPGTHVLSGYLGDTMWGVEDIKRERDLVVPGDLGEHLFRLVWGRALTTPWAEVRRVLTTDNWDAFGYADTIRNYPGTTLEERYSRWFAGDRDTNRINFALQVHRDQAFYLAPNVESRVVRYAHRMPVHLRRGGRAYFGAMRHGFPTLYGYPTTRNFGYPLDKDVRVERALVKRGKEAMRQIEQLYWRLTGDVFFYPSLIQCAHPLEYSTKRHRAAVLGYLESLQPMQILDARGLSALRDAYARHRPHSPQLIKALITVGQWQARFTAPAKVTPADVPAVRV